MNDQQKDNKGSEQGALPEASQPESGKQAKTPESESIIESAVETADDALLGKRQSALDHSEKGNSMSNETSATSRSGGKGWALLAVLIALLALALSSYPYWPWQIPGTTNPIDHTAALTELEQEMSQLQSQQTALQRDLDGRLDRQQAGMRELSDEMQQYASAAATENSLDIEAFTAETEARIDSQIQTVLQAQLALQEASQSQQFSDLQTALETDLQADVQARLDERLNGFTSQLDQRLESLQNQQTTALEEADGRIEALTEESRQQLEQMATRLESVGQELDDTGQSAAQRLMLIQVEALLALGQDRLELDDDGAGANAAFERALERLQAQPVAAFDSLQQRIEREQAAIEDYLQNQSEVTPAQRFVRMNELAGQVPEWPAYAESVTQPEATDAESRGWGERVGQALSGLVRIENVAEVGPSAPEVELARIRIQQALQSAALAGVRQDWNLNQVLIEAAQAEMQTVLNMDDRTVGRALEALDELKMAPDPSDRPSLGQARAQAISLLERSQ